MRHDNDYELANSSIKIRLHGPGCGLSLIQPAGDRPGFACTADDLYSLELTSPEGEKRSIGSSQAIRVEGRREDGSLLLTFTHRTEPSGGAQIVVRCSLSLAGQGPQSEWRIEIENGTDCAIQRVRFPLAVLEKRPIDPACPRYRYPYDWNLEYASALLLGLYDGTLIPEPYEEIPDGFGWAEEHPGRMSAQMAAYFDVHGGLCLFTKDGQGCPKLLGFKRQGAGLDISPTHLFPRAYGASVHLSYAVALEPFSGDWAAAADVYKRWAVDQEWTQTPLSGQGRLPAWLKAGYPFVFYAQGHTGMIGPRQENQDSLPARMLPVLQAYEKLLDSPLGVMIYGWEKNSSWITPDVFPAYPSNEEIHALIAALKASGSRVCLLNSGTRWAVKNPRDPGWDGTQAWEKEGRSASCVGEGGEWAYDSRPWAVNHKLCIAAEGTRKVLDHYMEGLAALGVDATQYDQNLGGETYVCYGSQHGHPPGYGPWMYAQAKRVLGRFLEESRMRNPDFAVSVEEPNEALIPYLSFYNGRPYIYHGWPMLSNMLCVGVPLFSYLYHEYAIGYGGDLPAAISGEASERVKIGRTIAAGYLVQVGLASEAYAFKEVQAAVHAGQPLPEAVPPALRLLKNAARAYQGYAHDFLILGRMLPAPPYDVEEAFELSRARAQSYYTDERVEYVHPESAGIRVPAVLACAWLSPSGAPGLVFVNMSENRQKVRLNLASLGQGWGTVLGRQLVLENLDGITPLILPAGSNGSQTLDLPGLQVSLLRPMR
jgi:hypothetical protein